ncbi:MAG TPA: TonB family protein [Candidatus Eremiobacteraceae bacterium]|jgi:TonB family protein|nr:TonB family protein [Candidatus Eremiobacteraceae bacterium]
MSDSWRDSEGQVIDGKFPLVKFKAATDHSVVFSTLRGQDKNEKAAIKFIQADASNSDDQLARWRHAAQLSHPNLIKVFESGRCQLAGLDLLYVVMEQTQENLGEFLPQRALSADETHDMLGPFVDALSYLHGKGFAHGRIKPGNILAIDDQLKLSSDSISREGDMQIGAGKPDIFVAPETNGRATKAGDSWSLGATIVESLTQRRPEETAGDPGFPDSVQQPFLDIARNTLRRDAKARWTIAEISDRLNTKAASEPVETVAVSGPSTSMPPTAATAAKPAPAASPSSVAIAEPPKPASSKPAGSLSAAASAGTATAVAVAHAPVESKAVPLAKPTKSIDPLSVPLSNVAPKFDAGKSSSKGWYIAILLLIAAAAGAWYYVPQVREFTQSVITNSPAAQPSAQPAQPSPSVPASQPSAQPALPADSKPDTTPAAKPSTPAPAPTHHGVDGPQISSTKPPASATPTSTPASERTPLKNAASTPAPKTSAALAASSIAPLPAMSRTAAVAPTSLPAGPVTQGAPLNQVMPEISSRARSTIHGTVRVILKVRVDASGAVETAVPASSPSRFFSDAAIQAAKQWDFTPAKISGQPVRSEWLVRFDFSPTDTKVLPSQTKP